MKSKCFFKVLIPHLAILTVFLMSGSALAQAPLLCELDPISQTRCEDFDAAFTVTASGGVPPYTYSWSGPACPCTGPTLDSIRVPSVTLADAGIYTVVITDAAGNQTTCSGQLIVNENPICDITGGGDVACPNETIQYCAPAGMDEYNWNISGNGTIIGPTDQQCVTVTAGEQCGQSFTIYQSVTDNLCILRCDRTVTIDDVDPPVCTPPGPITVECEEDVPAPDVSLLSCEDNCDPNPTKTWISDSPLSAGPCGGTIMRTYRCEDACGNFSECTQLITVEDTTPPTVTCPGDFTVQCVADIPDCDPANATATDNCSDVTVTCSQGPLVGDQCPATVTVTYTATDACGNSASCTQVITVDDLEDPTIVCPNGMTVQCEEDLPAAATTVADFIALGGQVGDNCDGNLVLSSTDGSLINGVCGGTVARTYSVTDDCGNTASCDQVFTVNDTENPVISCPDGITVQCEDDVPDGAATMSDFLALGGQASDNCDVDLSLSFADSPLSGGVCGGTITRTYTVTDDCGNTASCDQIITLNDTEDPVIACPDGITVQCEDDVPAGVTTVAAFVQLGGEVSDNCDDNPSISFSDAPLSGAPCSGTITRTYTVTDDCGNSASCDQIITVNDTEDPVIACPDDMTVQCRDDVPAAATTVSDFVALGGEATDNCDDELTLGWTDGELDGSVCGGTITRTYTVTDDCGNTASCDQIITVDDTEDPVIACLDGITVQCEDDVRDGVTTVAAFVQLGGEVSDNCDDNLSLSFSDAPLSGAPCGGTITRTYTVTDDCGNSASCDQIITVNDTIAPVITDVGGPQTIECPAEPQFSEPTVMDNCDDAPELSFTDEIVEEGDCGAYVVTRTWTAVDACGNEAETQSQTITVECPCPADEFCTFTQGYYGNEGGFKNGESTIEILDRLIPAGDPLVVGMPGRSVTFYDGSEMCILELLPGGGPSSALPDDGDIEINSTEDCSELGGGNDQGQRGVGNRGRGGKGGGGLKNSLFNQTLTLSLNVRYSDSLEYVELCNVWVVQDANCGPNGFCGDDDDFPEGEISEWYFSDGLLQALADEGLPQTVGGLLELANRGLAGLSTGGLELSAISEAVDRINNAFDECKFLIECNDSPGDMLGKTSLPKSNTVPAEFALNQNHPNPFNPSTTISYSLSEDGQVDLSIFNVLGQQVATVVSGFQPAGNHQVVWDGCDQSGRAMSTGMYFYRLKGGNEVGTKKMILLK